MGIHLLPPLFEVVLTPGVPQPYASFTSGADGTGAPIDTITWVAQTFTAPTAHILRAVKLKLYRSVATGDYGDLIVSIRAVDGAGKPTGADLSTGSLDANLLPDTAFGTWWQIYFSSGVALTAATKYAIVCRLPGATFARYVRWTQGPPGVYTDGSRADSADSGVSWTLQDPSDGRFEELGTPT